jgi:hypothetical protein
MTRRSFLHSTAYGTLAATASVQQVLAQPAIRLGFDSYSLRAWRWKDMQLLDYAAGLKLDSVQLSGLDDYQSLEPAHLAKVRDHAARLGLSIDGGIGCICPTSKSWNPKSGTPAAYLEQGLSVSSGAQRTGAGRFQSKHISKPL